MATKVQSPTPVPDQPYVIGEFRITRKTLQMPDGLLYRYNPDPSIDLIHTLAQLEQGMADEDGTKLAETLMEGHDLIMRLLAMWNINIREWRELNGDPDKDADGEPIPEEQRLQFPQTISLTAMELYQTCTLISGGESAAKQIADTLNLAQFGEEDDEEASEPVPLKKRSGGRSPGSAKKTTGGRRGGSASRGGTSESNSTKPHAA